MPRYFRRHRRQVLKSVVIIARVKHHHHLSWRTKMSSIKVTVGHSVAYSLAFLDQNGNPMIVTPKPDAAPVWSNTTPATEMVTAAADGLSATGAALAAGTDVVSVSLAVSGTSFSDSIDVEVDAAPQVLTSVKIVATAS
jgi:hypothetical protein